MDFFAQQDAARRNTRLLVVLFVAAVFLLILLTNAAVAAFLFFQQDYDVAGGSRTELAGYLSYFTFARFGTTGLAITATVALVVLFKWMQLSTGGKAVAEGMGGTRIVPETRDRDEQRCLNVVEEMALAANMPVPPVYVLNGERGINAFAAGISPADAVVAVTRGTISTLKRHELQGVIAHEFSHILNGDMRLNIRLAAMLKGITFIGDVGYFLMRGNNRIRSGSGSRSGGAGLPVLGLALWLLGMLGEVIAGVIKSAISRQKEYLADASAVQYTRSAESIGDALKVIGGFIPGTFVHGARAAEMSHIFFCQILHPLWHWFPTHPPLEERIRRVDPRWDGRYIERKPEPYGKNPSRPGYGETGVGRAEVVAAALATAAALDASADAAGNASSDAQTEFAASESGPPVESVTRDDIPPALQEHSHNPLGAQALVLSLLLAEEEECRQTQLGLVGEAGTQGLEELVVTLAPGVNELGAPRRLPLLEMCMPALKSMSAGQYRVFKQTLLRMIQADRQTELYEWCLFQLVRHYLDPEFVQVKTSRARIRRLSSVHRQLSAVLSVLVYAGEDDPQRRFELAAGDLELPRARLLPREEVSVADFSRAVHALADCYPLLKPRILKAMVRAASQNGSLNPTEREVISSIAAVMDCPLPTLPGI